MSSIIITGLQLIGVITFLGLMYMMLLHMQVAAVNEKGAEILAAANEFNLTFYDSTYLVEAMKNNWVLVTDNAKVAKAAEKLNVATIPSSIPING